MMKNLKEIFKGTLKRVPFFFSVLLPLISSAQKNFTFDKTCQFAYYKMLSMHFEEADSFLQLEKKNNPDNLMPYFIDDYKDFFELAFNEDATQLSKLEGNRAKRIDILDDGPKDSPYYLYTQAVVNLHWAFVHLKFEQWTTSFFEMKKGYSGLNENNEKFPGFIANHIFLGFIHGMIGTVPDSYKWGVNILGFSGTVQQGMNEIEAVMNYAEKNPFIFEDEARYTYIFMKMGLQDDAQGAFEQTKTSDYPNMSTNPFSTFVKGYLATKTNANDEAIKILSAKDFRNGSFQLHYMDYMLGTAKLRRLDDDANIPLENFTKNFKGRNYLKDTYQKLAWYYLMKGDQEKYHYYISFCKTAGATFVDSDQEALKEAQTGIEPNLILLKTRLLQDGGYYEKAIAQLNGRSIKDFPTDRDKIEFPYRAGRIYHEWGKADEAIPYYNTTIEHGANFSFYFAARAALELGLIYEQRSDFEKARLYFKKCLSMKNTEYKTSLDQKAKAGLERVEGK